MLHPGLLEDVLDICTGLRQGENKVLDAQVVVFERLLFLLGIGEGFTKIAAHVLRTATAAGDLGLAG